MVSYREKVLSSECKNEQRHYRSCRAYAIATAICVVPTIVGGMVSQADTLSMWNLGVIYLLVASMNYWHAASYHEDNHKQIVEQIDIEREDERKPVNSSLAHRAWRNTWDQPYPKFDGSGLWMPTQEAQSADDKVVSDMDHTSVVVDTVAGKKPLDVSIIGIKHTLFVNDPTHCTVRELIEALPQDYQKDYKSCYMDLYIDDNLVFVSDDENDDHNVSSEDFYNFTEMKAEFRIEDTSDE